MFTICSVSYTKVGLAEKKTKPQRDRAEEQEGGLEQKPNWTKKPKVFFYHRCHQILSASLIQTPAATSKCFLLVLSYTRVFSSTTKHASPCFEHFGQHQPHRCPSLQPQEQTHYTQVCDSRMKRADRHTCESAMIQPWSGLTPPNPPEQSNG